MKKRYEEATAKLRNAQYGGNEGDDTRVAELEATLAAEREERAKAEAATGVAYKSLMERYQNSEKERRSAGAQVEGVDPAEYKKIYDELTETKDELAEVTTKFKALQTKYAKEQGYKMAMEREMLDKNDEIEALTQKVTAGRKAYAKADGDRMAQERDLLGERQKTEELTKKLETDLATLQATADLSKLNPDETADELASLRAEVTKTKAAYARADGQRMSLERELESASADQEELESLRAQVKSLTKKYSQMQGKQMALERDVLEKDEQIEELTKKVTEAQKRFAQAEGQKMAVERDSLAQIDDLQEQLQKLKG
jgi:chromosome segregation ATPase